MITMIGDAAVRRRTKWAGVRIAHEVGRPNPSFMIPRDRPLKRRGGVSAIHTRFHPVAFTAERVRQEMSVDLDEIGTKASRTDGARSYRSVERGAPRRGYWNKVSD